MTIKDTSGDVSTPHDSIRRLSRRQYLRASLLAGVSAVAGCNRATSNIQPRAPSGVRESVPTKYWHDWSTIDADTPPLDYTARVGAPLDPVTVEYSSEDDPWMREHGLLFERALDSLGVPSKLIDRPLNQLYAQSWDTAGLENVISMSSHGPDPQRGLDPNPFLMRLHKDNPSNYTNYWHPTINELLNTQRRLTGEPERREKLVGRIQRLFAADVGDIITLFPNVITAANTEKWDGYVPTPGNGYTGDAFQWTEVNLQPKTDDTAYVKGITTSMNSLNLPWAAGGDEELRLKFIYDSLFDASPNLDIIPALGTDAEITGDKTIEVKLRDGVTWHDGTPFTAEDVKFSTEYYIEKNSTSQATFYKPIESVDVLSSHRVRFNLKWPDASFTTQRLVRSAIIPKHQWEDIDSPAQHNPTEPIGTGPFKFVRWNQGTRFELERNDEHWMFDDDWRATALGKHATRGPGIERVIWINVGNIDAMLGALTQSQLDAVGSTLSNAQADRVAASDAISKLSTENFAPVAVKLMHSCPLIRDKEFRIALSMAVDNRSFVEDVLRGEATSSAGENYISELVSPWHTPETRQYRYDPTEARRILERAGYLWGDNGTLHFPNKDGWAAFLERIQNGNTHKRRTELGQPDFSKQAQTTEDRS
ncbi:ABC transporter substrate-binding protein [Halocatena pleomorpha]|uniref:ABC transporter substrate-binding protein n=1 Tax=Halocatena pleomorpha TaxID=1785090 RepID=A0A3P3R8G9_9EURY|nr:ABC transporter substrate-binding protein [Halocatena pleomorpha]RRJ28940.1 ABC transporter substrate-binding protein [Halocatena pleomorpha]